ncbi:MAG: triose-phosphate isomerase, partial [Odoribacteraceae bacterium]|nr:triose-phosphate isomerase [Odoribacteraceae bacterium]
MRKKIVAGNWKMNKTYDEGLELSREINEYLRYKEGADGVIVILGTPFIHLAKVAHNITEPGLSVSAQDCSTQKSGAYTGEISADMIASTGAKHVIIGHSERRLYHGETDAILAKKVTRALETPLRVIFCVGEALAEREADAHFDVVKRQLTGGLFHATAGDLARVVIAYEPVWAIGTGKTATPDQAQQMHAFIRATVAERYGNAIADETSILYGGSCSPANANDLFSKPDVDGGLIGGASLKAADFFEILTARAQYYLPPDAPPDTPPAPRRVPSGRANTPPLPPRR